MAALDIQAMVLFIVRVAPAIIFILIMMLLFFSFRVQLRNDSMQRLTVELSDAISGGPLTDHRSVFDSQKLNFAETQNNTELYAQNCDFGYNVKVQSIEGPTNCKVGNDCIGFCNTICGLDSNSIVMSDLGTLNGNCGCNIENLGLTGTNFCQCKKPGGDWQDSYGWKYGYTPASGVILSGNKISESHSEFPAAVNVNDNVLPAKLKITVYDAVLTRLTCVTTKAYELKEQQTTSLDRIYGAVFRRTDPQGTNACIYDVRDSPVDCRYFPGVNFEPFNVIKAMFVDGGIIPVRVTAYPLKTAATCDTIKSDPSVIAGADDTIATVVLCAEPIK